MIWSEVWGVGFNLGNVKFGLQHWFRLRILWFTMFRSNPKNFGISSFCKYCSVITFCPELAMQVFLFLLHYTSSVFWVWNFTRMRKINFEREYSVTIFFFLTKMTKCQRKYFWVFCITFRPGFLFSILSIRWTSDPTTIMNQIWLEVRENNRNTVETCLVLVTYWNSLSKLDF